MSEPQQVPNLMCRCPEVQDSRPVGHGKALKVSEGDPVGPYGGHEVSIHAPFVMRIRIPQEEGLPREASTKEIIAEIAVPPQSEMASTGVLCHTVGRTD